MNQKIKLDRNNVYITNVVNYRPPENRKPDNNEINRYLPFLTKHIEIINPKILILLGSTALNTLIGSEEVISKVRGKWINKKIGSCIANVIISFHPAFLMRQPEQKKMAWVDLKMIRKKISDLNIKIEGIPTEREESGLAKSSRNKYLGHVEKEKATLIYRSLCKVRQSILDSSSLDQALDEAIELLEENSFKVDYFEARSRVSLKSSNDLEDVILFCAATINNVRLIDNLKV